MLNIFLTREYSSKMHTACFSCHLEGEGVSAQTGVVCPGGGSVCLDGGCLPRGVCSSGVSA